MKKSFRYSWIVLLLGGLSLAGCKKYLQVPLPINYVAGSAVFQNDNTASAALSGIYGECYQNGYFDGNTGLGFVTGMYGDELANQSTLATNLALYADGVSSTVGGVTGFWSGFYYQVYAANLAIEGLKGASGLNFPNQWLGEAYFSRALLYFYITNLYGDAPLVLSSDYLPNNALPRSPQADVYKQIVADLKQAQSLLDIQYHDANGAVTADRGRPNKAAATALLARVYLYTGDWQDAESQADSVIADATDYQLPALSKVFLVNSQEVIWGIEPFNIGFYPYVVKDVRNYYLPAGLAPVSAGVWATLSTSLVNAFEPGDGRLASWVGKDSVSPSAVYYYPYKYEADGNYTTPQETVVLFRLAEQYLIRAEARAQQNNLGGAAADLNVIRARAGLGASLAVTQSDLLGAILQERRVELFTEEGNRFFDLRRTGNLDAVMTIAAPSKGGSWAAFKDWWPIPESDIENDTHLTQTPGYQ